MAAPSTIGLELRALVVAMLGVTVALTVDGFEFDEAALVALIVPTFVAEAPTGVVPAGNFTVMATSPVVPAGMGLTMVNVAVPVDGLYAVAEVCASPPASRRPPPTTAGRAARR